MDFEPIEMKEFKPAPDELDEGEMEWDGEMDLFQTPATNSYELNLWVDQKDKYSIQGNKRTSALRAKISRMVSNKPYILNQVFEGHFDPNDGPNSKFLFDNLDLTYNKTTGKIDGAKFLGEKVVIR